MHEVVLIIHTTASSCSRTALKNQMTDHAKGRKVNIRMLKTVDNESNQDSGYGYN